MRKAVGVWMSGDVTGKRGDMTGEKMNAFWGGNPHFSAKVCYLCQAQELDPLAECEHRKLIVTKIGKRANGS